MGRTRSSPCVLKVDTERFFYRLNGLFCMGVAANFLWSAGLLHERTFTPFSEKELEHVLRHLAGGGPHLLLLVGYLPALLVISVMLAFYLYLHHRARYLSLLALLSGILLSGLLLIHQISRDRVLSLALQYVATTEYTARGELLQEARRALDLHLMHGLLVNRASIVAYALYGFLFQKSRRLLEVIVGYAFLASALLLLLAQVLASAGSALDLAKATSVPAFAFIAAAIVLFRARREEE
jgi:hypothetical protein